MAGERGFSSRKPDEALIFRYAKELGMGDAQGSQALRLALGLREIFLQVAEAFPGDGLRIGAIVEDLTETNPSYPTSLSVSAIGAKSTFPKPGPRDWGHWHGNERGHFGFPE